MSKTLDKQFSDAATWEDATIHVVYKHRFWLMILSALLLISVMCLALAIASLSPAIRTEPIPIVVDKSNGNVEVLTKLDEVLNYTDKETVIVSFITRYLTNWKTFDRNDAEQRASFIQLFSDFNTFEQYKAPFQTDSDENPYIYYKNDGQAHVTIIGVTRLNETTLSIRYKVTESFGRQIDAVEKYFTSIVKYKLTNKGMQMQQRWINPLGLIVTSIRFDEDFIK